STAFSDFKIGFAVESHRKISCTASTETDMCVAVDKSGQQHIISFNRFCFDLRIFVKERLEVIGFNDFSVLCYYAAILNDKKLFVFECTLEREVSQANDL